MKILYVTTIGTTMRFFMKLIEELIANGHTVDIAANDSVKKVPNRYRELGCRVFTLPCSRSPLNYSNYASVGRIRAIVEEGKYDIVHCHTPVAAMCTRLACRKLRKNGVKVIYTAHGFHFYKGAPIKNWLLYYPLEKICAYFTDVLITINKEDFALAQKKMKAKCVAYVPGVGIDLEKFGKSAVERNRKRQELGVPEDAVLLLSVGELNSNKNHEAVIRAIADMDVYYIIAGAGGLHQHLQNVIDTLGLSRRVKLLGFRSDVKELYEAADVFVFPSFREGLPVSMMEAMASGLPCVASRIRGNTDLMEHGINGFLCDPADANSVAECIGMLTKDQMSAREFAERSKEIMKEYDVANVIRAVQGIYEKVLQG